MMSHIINPGDINLWVVLSFDRKTKMHWVEVLNAADNFPAAEEYSFTAVDSYGPIKNITEAIRLLWKQNREREKADPENPQSPIEEAQHDGENTTSN
jgi:hypothetical protein